MLSAFFVSALDLPPFIANSCENSTKFGENRSRIGENECESAEIEYQLTSRVRVCDREGNSLNGKNNIEREIYREGCDDNTNNTNNKIDFYFMLFACSSSSFSFF